MFFLLLISLILLLQLSCCDAYVMVRVLPVRVGYGRLRIWMLRHFLVVFLTELHSLVDISNPLPFPSLPFLSSSDSSLSEQAKCLRSHETRTRIHGRTGQEEIHALRPSQLRGLPLRHTVTLYPLYLSVHYCISLTVDDGTSSSFLLRRLFLISIRECELHKRFV